MPKVVVGLSGGVDSAISAYLLQKAGYEVVALFMRNWDSLLNDDLLGNKTLNDEHCTQEIDYQDALKVAKHLNIPLHRIDFIEEYWNDVFANFISEYKKGRTPNPDILCNKYIKFGYFQEYALKHFQADYIATGHYAILDQGLLYKAHDLSKDQSYFLAQLTKEQLENVLMPLGKWYKKDVRLLAQKINLPVASKKDSTGICFIGERNFQEFLKNYIPAQEGKIVSALTQKVLGTHQGTMYYTFGQRKGLNLGGMKEPHFVSGFNHSQKIIYVAPQSHRNLLLSNGLRASQLNLIDQNVNLEKITNLSAKFRYRQKDVRVKAKILASQEIYLDFATPQEAVTPGQQVVFYQNDKCLGGAVIEETFVKTTTEKWY